MENIIDTIVSDPMFIWVALILAIFLVLGLVKKIFKLVMAVIAAFVLYVGYLYYTGDDPANAVNEAIENIKEIDTKKIRKDLDKTLEDVQEKAEEALDKVKKKNK